MGEGFVLGSEPRERLMHTNLICRLGSGCHLCYCCCYGYRKSVLSGEGPVQHILPSASVGLPESLSLPSLHGCLSPSTAGTPIYRGVPSTCTVSGRSW